MRCKTCGAEIPDGAYFCGECGALTSGSSKPSPPPEPIGGDDTQAGGNGDDYTSRAMSACPYCGGRVAPEKAFCPHCGQKLNEQKPAMQPVSPQKDNTLMIVLVSVIGFLLVAAIVVVIVLLVNTGSKNVSSSSAVGGVTAMPMQTSEPAQIPTMAPNITTPVPAVTAQPSIGSADFIFPSDTRYVSDSDLTGRSQEEVRLMINEIYARHGYIFNNKNYQAYFSSKSWYVPYSSSQQDVERRFNAIELANKNFLAKYEQDRGWR